MWLDFLAEVMAAASKGEDDVASPVERAFTPSEEAENTIPFFALWQPFLVVARRRLVALAGLTLHWLTPEAAAGLAADLIRQLALQGAPAAQERFASFRTSHLSASAPTAPNGISTGVYDGFVASTRCDGMEDFFGEYSALARQLCLRTQQWVTNAARLLARLEADQAEIQTVFFEGQPPGSIRAVRAGLSDRHHGGQQVTALEFQSGLRLIYKPKSLAQEAAFQNLLGWLADTAAPDHREENSPCRRRCVCSRATVTVGWNASSLPPVRIGPEWHAIIAGQAVCCVCCTPWAATIVIGRTCSPPARGRS